MKRNPRSRLTGALLPLIVTGGLLLSLLLGPGCTSHPGTGFNEQLEELQWSTWTLLEQPRWAESLVEDATMLFDPEWGELPDSIDMLGW